MQGMLHLKLQEQVEWVLKMLKEIEFTHGYGLEIKGPYAFDGNYKANGLRWTDDPDYYYNRTIYIDARTPKSATVEEVHTDSIVGDSNAKNQEKYLLVNTGDAPGSLTPSE